jgi:hypothetical protein
MLLYNFPHTAIYYIRPKYELGPFTVSPMHVAPHSSAAEEGGGVGCHALGGGGLDTWIGDASVRTPAALHEAGKCVYVGERIGVVRNLWYKLSVRISCGGGGGQRFVVSGYVNGRCTAFVSVNFQNQLPVFPAEVLGGFLGKGFSLSLSLCPPPPSPCLLPFLPPSLHAALQLPCFAYSLCVEYRCFHAKL